MAGLVVTAFFRHPFAWTGFCLDIGAKMLLLWSFRHTDEVESTTEPTSPCLIGFR